MLSFEVIPMCRAKRYDGAHVSLVEAGISDGMDCNGTGLVWTRGRQYAAPSAATGPAERQAALLPAAAPVSGVAAPLPKAEGRPKSRHKSPAAAVLLRALLRQVAAEHGIASKLLASTEELDRMAAGDRDMPAFRGWRNRVFGQRAAALCDGRIALGVDGGKLREIPVDDPG